MQQDLDTARIVIHGAIAIVGGIVNAIRVKSNNVMQFIGNAIVASFTGFIFGLVAIHIFGNESYITMALAGTGGYMGIEGMNLLSKVVRKAILANIK